MTYQKNRFLDIFTYFQKAPEALVEDILRPPDIERTREYASEKRGG